MNSPEGSKQPLRGPDIIERATQIYGRNDQRRFALLHSNFCAIFGDTSGTVKYQTKSTPLHCQSPSFLLRHLSDLYVYAIAAFTFIDFSLSTRTSPAILPNPEISTVSAAKLAISTHLLQDISFQPQIMPEAEGSQSQTQSQRQNRGRNHGHRRGRGGKSRPQVDDSRSGGTSAPAQSEASQSQAGSAATQNQAQAPAQGPSRSNQRGRGGRPRGQRAAGRGAARNDVPRPQARRAFGGHLTSTTAEADDESVDLAASLSGDAPEFVPGQPIVPRR